MVEDVVTLNWNEKGGPLAARPCQEKFFSDFHLMDSTARTLAAAGCRCVNSRELRITPVLLKIPAQASPLKH
jgi:hypothetical protein